jgi:hypothetical protein
MGEQDDNGKRSRIKPGMTRLEIAPRNDTACEKGENVACVEGRTG